MTYEAVVNHADWHAKHNGNYCWVIRSNDRLDGTYFRAHMPSLIDDYDGHLELWWWDDE